LVVLLFLCLVMCSLRFILLGTFRVGSGAGDDFARWQHEQQHHTQARRSSTAAGLVRPASTSHGRRDPPEVSRAIEEGAAKLNAVAMFFLKKGFKHVR
jgi:hypothetical protein